MFPLNRVVALLTPAFTAASAAVSHLALTRLGFHLAPDALVPVETAVALSAAGAALKWLHGHQKYEALVHEAVALLPSDAAELASPPPTIPAEALESVPTPGA